MKKKVLFASALASALVSGTCFAGGECFGCRIKNIGVGPYYDSICSSSSCVFLALEPTVSSRPACSSNSYWHFVLDVSTVSGRATYAFLLGAYSTGENLNVAGAGSCSLSPGGTVENLYFANKYGP